MVRAERSQGVIRLYDLAGDVAATMAGVWRLPSYTGQGITYLMSTGRLLPASPWV